MSLLHPREPEKEYTENEQQGSFISRRMEAFADRSREPGDATTWEIVLGALMGTLLTICYSVAEQPLLALGTVVVLVAWIAYTSIVGRVNVFSVLWGSSTTDADVNPNHLAVLQSTSVLAALVLLAVVVDAFAGWAFGYYGIALVLVLALYIAVVFRSWIAPVSE